MEVPPGMLGVFNDMWFRYVQGISPAGLDNVQGGRSLLLGPGYDTAIPDGDFIVQFKTYRVWIFPRASIAEGVEAAVKLVGDNIKIYPLSQKDNPPQMELFKSSKQPFNTNHVNNFLFPKKILICSRKTAWKCLTWKRADPFV
jgi:hypothetical protein